MTLKKMIFEKGFTQTTLAHRLSVTQALISKWVNGQCQPQLSMITKLSSVLNVNEIDLINCFTKKER